jgi:hypothetical protein
LDRTRNSSRPCGNVRIPDINLKFLALYFLMITIV